MRPGSASQSISFSSKLDFRHASVSLMPGLKDSELMSVVIPVLHEEGQVAAALMRLQAAARSSRIEVIVVDGGSSDRTLELARAFDWVKVIECGPANRGRQMNAGARAAQGKTLLFLHADVEMPDDGIAAIRRALSGDDALGGCFQIRFPEQAPASLRLVARGVNFRTRLFRTATGDQAIFVRREVFAAIGGYQTIPLMEDVAFFNELKKRGRVTILGQQVVISPRRWLNFGVWRTVFLMYLLRFGYWVGVPPAKLKQFFLDVR